MKEKIVTISAEIDNIRGILIDFVAKGDKIYGIVKIGNKIEEVEIDKITIIDNL